VDDKVDDLTVLSSTLQSLPVLIAWGRCVRFVEFPDLYAPEWLTANTLLRLYRSRSPIVIQTKYEVLRKL
jgi:hypothetical protein